MSDGGESTALCLLRALIISGKRGHFLLMGNTEDSNSVIEHLLCLTYVQLGVVNS